MKHRQGNRERGVITAMFAVLAVSFFLIIALVAEGGRKLGNLSRAEDIAAEAARAAAATLDVSSIGQGRAIIDGTDDEGRARDAAIALVARFNDATIRQLRCLSWSGSASRQCCPVSTSTVSVAIAQPQ